MRRQREREHHRLEIMQAALRLFARDGFVQTTMADIAREADFSVGALYLHFPNKDGLLAAIFEHQTEMLIGVIANAAERDRPPLPRLRGVVEDVMTHFVANKDFFVVYRRATLSNMPGPPLDVVASKRECAHSYMRAIITEAVECCDLSGASADDLLVATHALIETFLHQMIDEPTRNPPKKTIPVILHMVFDRLLVPAPATALAQQVPPGKPTRKAPARRSEPGRDDGPTARPTRKPTSRRSGR